MTTEEGVYGLILVSGLIAASGSAGCRPGRRSCFATAATVLVFWIAHVYAGAVAMHGSPSAAGTPVSIREAARSAVRKSRGLLAATLAPAAALDDRRRRAHRRCCSDVDGDVGVRIRSRRAGIRRVPPQRRSDVGASDRRGVDRLVRVSSSSSRRRSSRTEPARPGKRGSATEGVEPVHRVEPATQEHPETDSHHYVAARSAPDSTSAP